MKSTAAEEGANASCPNSRIRSEHSPFPPCSDPCSEAGSENTVQKESELTKDERKDNSREIIVLALKTGKDVGREQ